MKLIGNGAEARVYLDAKKNIVLKRRIEKGYRITEIDKKLRVRRTRREAKVLAKLGDICPDVVDVFDNDISMNYLEGPMVKDVVDGMIKSKSLKIFKLVGEKVSKMHSMNVIHGDLTTSNMIVLGNDVKLIDFGLSFSTDKAEHKAVDVHLFKQALESKHHEHFKIYFESFLKGYKKGNIDYSEVIDRLEKVEKRGRYKRRVGA
ncbi:Kae1-associated serine/threonine protein kinase [Candidatus Woesearchaeota archaeon]|jgi:Kae1-associated kinase Bud32|nr:Kae1-associated serine/threonine protein kinase [Candidatus Woesearchaeota archaeon]MBT6044539.1 Kae1-associated serine/threonine protein kinase [Candidatus Woesearchaeota archaeon]